MLADDRRMSDELDDFSQQLKRLVPTRGMLDRDELLYRAGYEVGRQRLRRQFRWLSAVSFLMFCATSVMWLEREGRLTIPRATVTANAPTAAVSPFNSASSVPRIETDPTSRPERHVLNASSYLALRRMGDVADWRPVPASSFGESPADETPLRRQLERELHPLRLPL